MATPTDATRKSTPQGKERFAHQKDERLSPSEGYGAGVKDKTNPAPSTVPSSGQTSKAKPVGQGKSTGQTDRT